MILITFANIMYTHIIGTYSLFAHISLILNYVWSCSQYIIIVDCGDDVMWWFNRNIVTVKSKRVN